MLSRILTRIRIPISFPCDVKHRKYTSIQSLILEFSMGFQRRSLHLPNISNTRRLIWFIQPILSNATPKTLVYILSLTWAYKPEFIAVSFFSSRFLMQFQFPLLDVFNISRLRTIFLDKENIKAESWKFCLFSSCNITPSASALGLSFPCCRSKRNSFKGTILLSLEFFVVYLFFGVFCFFFFFKFQIRPLCCIIPTGSSQTFTLHYMSP